MKKLATLAALSSVCFLSACSHTPPAHTSSNNQAQKSAWDITSQVQAGQPIHLNGKTEVSFMLETNPTTGYGWVVESMSPDIKKIKSIIMSPSSGPMLSGAPSMEKFEFSVPKEGIITLGYKRSWETKTPPAKTLVIKFEQ